MSAPEAPFLQPRPHPEDTSRWKTFAVATGVLLVVLGAYVLLSDRPQPQTRSATELPPAHPYAQSLEISDLQLSAAENFVGATVNYLEGKLANKGTRTVTGVTVGILFHNGMGQVVQNEREQVHSVLGPTGHIVPDPIPLNRAPLKAGQSIPFRITLEHISADWDHSPPEMRIVDVKFSE